MSALHPLFLLGAFAVAVPVVLHLLHRRTRKEQPWSTLRFLDPSPPRFDRRARIDDRALLALRVLALLLLAASFARPFFDRPPPAVLAGTGTTTVIVLDTSASMRRTGSWKAALAEADRVLDAAGAADRVAILAFDTAVRTVLPFEAWARRAPRERAAEARRVLAATSPSFRATDLGRAVTAAAELLAEDEGSRGTARVVIVSDFQRGARLDVRAGDLPATVGLELRRVGDAGPNLSLAAVPDVTDDEQASLRLRLACELGPCPAATLRSDEGWTQDLAAFESAGTRVVTTPRPRGPTAFRLMGDAETFDDTTFVAPARPARARIVCVGPDAGDDPKGAAYYLVRAFPVTRRLAPTVATVRAEATDARTFAEADLVVVTGALDRVADALRAHLARGRTAVVALDAAEQAAALGALVGGGLEAEEVTTTAVLTAIDTGHPSLRAFADRHLGDLSRVSFWRHRRLSGSALTQARVLARFDDGSPAVLVWPVEGGELIVLAAGWTPRDGQLALSSRFVPLVHGWLESRTPVAPARTQLVVGDEGTTEPGLIDRGERGVIAVNIDPAESQTAPLEADDLDRVGLVARAPARGAAPGTREAAFRAGLEAEQKLWRYGIATLLALLVVETAWAARRVRRRAEGAAS